IQTAKQIDIHTADKHEGQKVRYFICLFLNKYTIYCCHCKFVVNEFSPIEEEPELSQDSSTDYSFALLPPLSPENKGKRCLVLDLDETLVHSSFKPINSADFVIPVEIDGVVHRVYVLKRPFVDEFLLECSKSYELVIFTASLSKYADPLLDQLDTHRVLSHRLFRESCTLHGSAYVKVLNFFFFLYLLLSHTTFFFEWEKKKKKIQDMRRLGRRLKDIIFVDNSPHSYAFQPKNAVPIASWFDDKTDTQVLRTSQTLFFSPPPFSMLKKKIEFSLQKYVLLITQLKDFLPVLNTTLIKVRDVRNVLDAHNKPFNWLCRQANVDISKFEPEQ
ncbi:carboxy-terminal domain RNA polymerase II polypeptide A small phosphatase 2, partial [Reticulomyxa filosa]